jgi:hypothetical protein
LSGKASEANEYLEERRIGGGRVGAGWMYEDGADGGGGGQPRATGDGGAVGNGDGAERAGGD